MKDTKRIIFLLVCIFTISLISCIESNASLHLNNISFEAKINKDSSMDVTEYWDIDISETNTLYKVYNTDKEKYSKITNVKVREITEGREREFQKINDLMYHVTKNCYYGLNNDDGNFEIAWGVGLDDDSDTRKYAISYTVKDAIAKYNDCAELYWQFIGEEFEVSASNVSGTIYLPQYAESKEQIRVWGHTKDLNGTIYVTDLNKVDFNLDGRNKGNYVEVRVLFPTEMITVANRIKNIDMIESVVDEETTWANEANARRTRNRIITILVIFAITTLIDIILISKIKKYSKEDKCLEEKYIPQDIEYYRELPRKDATPGEASMIIKKAFKSILGDIGSIFAATVLDLNLKKYIDFEPGTDKDEVKIKKNDSSKKEELKEDEKLIMDFLDSAFDKYETLTLKNLKKYIEGHPSKVEKLNNKVEQAISNSLKEKKLCDEEKFTRKTNLEIGIVLYCMILLASIISAFLVGEKISIILVSITGILSIITFIKAIKLNSKISTYTKDGLDEVQKWKAFKKFMEDYSLLKEKDTLDIVLWEQYLVYATVFGISKKVIKQLKMAYPDLERSGYLDSYVYMNLVMNTNFASTFSNTVSTAVSSAYSSATGGGGGFSGGGGGGRWTAAVEEVDKLSTSLKIFLKCIDISNKSVYNNSV